MKRRHAISLIGCGVAGLLAGCNGKKEEGGAGKGGGGSDGGAKVLRFSAIPDKNTTGQAELYKPVADYLAKALGIEVEFVPSPDYPASVIKFEHGDIQLAWFGGVTGVQAMQAVEGARALVAGEKDLAFKSYFIANASTGLQPSADFPAALADLTFTFGSQGSTSGCVMPSHYIMEFTGKTPQEFFTKQIGFSGAHDATATQVQDGTFQAGVLNYSTYDTMVAEGKIDPEKCVKIWETPTYADYNFTAHPSLEKTFGAGFLDKLQKALVECDDAAALKALDRNKLVKVSNETFAGIAAVLEKVKFD
jgi:phosphonate transport system substrate-binding protein